MGNYLIEWKNENGKKDEVIIRDASNKYEAYQVWLHNYCKKELKFKLLKVQEKQVYLNGNSGGGK